jgi:undecaprenyl-phosphate 4-deoxy-4-formamido-L-arabinose transferase
MMRNYGQHNATLCGVRAARYEVVVTMDQDLQHPPEEIPLLLAKLNEGYDVVYGAPRKLPQALWRNVMTAGIKWILAKVIGLPSVYNVSAFRAFRTSLREAFVNFQSGCFALLGHDPLYVGAGRYRTGGAHQLQLYDAGQGGDVDPDRL